VRREASPLLRAARQARPLVCLHLRHMGWDGQRVWGGSDEIRARWAGLEEAMLVSALNQTARVRCDGGRGPKCADHARRCHVFVATDEGRALMRTVARVEAAGCKAFSFDRRHEPKRSATRRQARSIRVCSGRSTEMQASWLL